MKLISNEVENYGNTLVEQWLTAFYSGKNLEKLDPDGVLYRFHLSHNDLDGLACHVVSTVYDCALNRFEIPLVDLTDALQYKNWDEVHVAHHRMPILHSICKAGKENIKEALHLIFESCCRSVFYKPVGPKDQIILLITDLGGITDSMFDEFYETYGDRFQVIVIDHHLATTPDRGKCDPNQIFWYVTGYQEDNLQSATKNLFTATYGSYDAVHTTSTASCRVSKKQETFVKQLTEYVEAVSMYDTGWWGEWLGRSTPDDVDLSVQHQLYFNRMAWDNSADVFHHNMISSYVQDMIHLLSTEYYVRTNLQYWEIVSNNLNELHKEFYDMRQLTLLYNPHVNLTLKIDPINGVYNPATRHMIRLGDISADVQLVNNLLQPLVTFGIIELREDQRQTRKWKYFSLCSHEIMKKYMLDLFILVDEPKGTVSLRSMNNHGFEINCADIAWRNGGGGHKRAAGYPIPKGEVPEDTDTDTKENDADADDWEDDTEEAKDDGTEEADADDSGEDSEEEDSDEELHPIVDRDRVIRWAGINWRPLQQDDDLLYLTPYEPTDDVKTCTYDEVDAVAAEWAVKHLSAFHRSLLIPIQINGKSYNVAPITLEHILNILDARNAKHAQICMPYGNVPYWTGSSAYNGGDTDDMVWCMNEKGQNVPVNKDAFLAFRPMICLHIINVLDYNLVDGKPIVPTPNIQNAYPSVGARVYWAWNDWIITHVDQKMVYMTLADVVPDWYVAWNDLQDACTTFANKFTEEESACLKSVTAGNTSGKVFVATYDQMDGDFSYFNSDNRRRANDWYWTSTEFPSSDAWSVCTDGIFGLDGRSNTGGFRPSVCVDPTLCDSGNSEGSDEPELNPELPDKSSLTIGNTVTFAGKQWIVSHKTADTCYLTLKDVLGNSTWDNLQENCTNFANSLSEAQRRCLKPITAGNTSGKVFVATKDQMDGGFSYFGSDSQRSVGSVYWTSTEDTSVNAWYVRTDGSLNYGIHKSYSLGFRPSVAIWTKRFYN